MELQPPKDLTHHLSRLALRRQASAVKGLYRFFFIPGINNLAGGFPNPRFFPYDTLGGDAALPNRFKTTEYTSATSTTATTAGQQQQSRKTTPSSERVVVPHDSDSLDPFQKIDLTTALQYGTAQGYPALHNFVKQFTLTRLHPSIPYEGGADVILTCGSTDGFSKTVQIFSNMWDAGQDDISERQGMLCEEFAYPAPIQEAKARGLNVVPVAIDDEGMLATGPDGLEQVLSNWDCRRGRRPHLMYTVTMGQNPTSGLLSLKRKKQIYALCQKYDIIIVEDDPYWYLQYPSAVEPRETTPETMYGTAAPEQSSRTGFLESLVPSYLSIDVDGRVVRLDTFSKTIAPGCRLGWVTAQPATVERFARFTESSTQQPSGFVQSIVAELLLGPSHHDKSNKTKQALGWHVDGWIRWLEGLRGNYERNMQVMAQTLDEGKYLVKEESLLHNHKLNNLKIDTAASATVTLPTDDNDYEVVTKTQLYSFTYPRAGMFLWLRMHFESHPLFDDFPPFRLSQAMWVLLTRPAYLVLLAPGFIFAPTDEIREATGWQYFRFCFANVEPDEIRHVSRNFIAAVRDFWHIEDRQTIDKLLEDVAVVDDAEGSGQQQQHALDERSARFGMPFGC